MSHRWLMLCGVLALAGCKDHASAAETKALLEKKMAGAKAGEEREIEGGVFMTMYRSQATGPVVDGWQLATSTGGGFSVELPIPYNDFRMRSRAEDGVDVFTDSIGAKSPGLLAWSATCLHRADGKLDVKGTAPKEDKIQAMGSPVKAWTRTIPGDGKSCVLVVEAQGTDPLPSEVDVQRFLHSFKRR